MNIKDCLLDETKRLNRLNDCLEKKIIKGEIFSNEPEQIICNVKAICKIAKSIGILHSDGII